MDRTQGRPLGSSDGDSNLGTSVFAYCFFRESQRQEEVYVAARFSKTRTLLGENMRISSFLCRLCMYVFKPF